MTLPVVLVTHNREDAARRAILDVIGDIADVRFLPELPAAERTAALRDARAVMTYHPVRELGRDGLDRLDACELIQCLTAGIDYLPLSEIPAHIPVAYNAGAFAKPMAEHVAAMALAGAKRLRAEHLNMQQGAFNQFHSTRAIDGATCGILGYGETGREVARLLRPLGMKIAAVNRRGATDDEVAFAGTLDDLGHVLDISDVLVITLSLTKKTLGLIGTRELARMKPDAVLVNVARGEIADETALYRHLVDNPAFTACIDAWWIEPVRHGRFETSYDFLSLPNVIGSPHNSGMTEGALTEAAGLAAQNVRRLLTGEAPRFVAGDDERIR